jgi:hypothetical protein
MNQETGVPEAIIGNLKEKNKRLEEISDIEKRYGFSFSSI